MQQVRMSNKSKKAIGVVFRNANMFLSALIIFFSLYAVPTSAKSDDGLGVKEVNLSCSVGAVYPLNADFFRHVRGPKPPVVGDVIEIRFGEDVITDIIFASGNGLTLSAVGAKLHPVASNQLGRFAFHGRHIGTIGRRYTGSLQAQVSADGMRAHVELIVMSERAHLDSFVTEDQAYFTQHSLEMECDVLN